MKKVLTSILIITLIISSFAMSFKSYAADPDVIFTVESMNAQVMYDYVTVKVNINCTNSFAAANFEIRYDDSKLEYIPFLDNNDEVDYTQNYGSTIENQNNETTVLINSNTPGLLKIGYMSTANMAGKNGEFLKLQFNVLTEGESTISMSATTLKNNNGNDLLAEFNNGTFVGLLRNTI